jgi:hypothetical protein
MKSIEDVAASLLQYHLLYVAGRKPLRLSTSLRRLLWVGQAFGDTLGVLLSKEESGLRRPYLPTREVLLREAR